MRIRMPRREVSSVYPGIAWRRIPQQRIRRKKEASVLGASRNAKTGDAGVTANAAAIAGAGGVLAGWLAKRRKDRKNRK